MTATDTGIGPIQADEQLRGQQRLENTCYRRCSFAGFPVMRTQRQIAAGYYQWRELLNTSEQKS